MLSTRWRDEGHVVFFIPSFSSTPIIWGFSHGAAHPSGTPSGPVISCLADVATSDTIGCRVQVGGGPGNAIRTLGGRKTALRRRDLPTYGVSSPQV